LMPRWAGRNSKRPACSGTWPLKIGEPRWVGTPAVSSAYFRVRETL
jgi:hypothetical protein